MRIQALAGRARSGAGQNAVASPLGDLQEEAPLHAVLGGAPLERVDREVVRRVVGAGGGDRFVEVRLAVAIKVLAGVIDERVGAGLDLGGVGDTIVIVVRVLVVRDAVPVVVEPWVLGARLGAVGP